MTPHTGQDTEAGPQPGKDGSGPAGGPASGPAGVPHRVGGAGDAGVDRLLAEGPPVGMAAVARQLAVDPATVTRWCHRGVRRADGAAVRLEHWRVGGRLVTTHPAVRRFVAAQQPDPAAGEASPAVPRPPAVRRRADDHARRTLRERYGV